MTKRYDVYGIGNGIMDVLLSIDDLKFAALGIDKGSFRLVAIETQIKLLDQLMAHEPTLASGGSAANTVIAVAQLGGKAAFSCCLGNDHYGHLYRNEFQLLGIDLHTKFSQTGITGSSVILVTPDAERTLNTALGTSADFGIEHLEEDKIKAAKWIYIEGYLLASPPSMQAALRSVEIARRYGTKVAVTFSDSFIVEQFSRPLRQIVEHSDLVFANANEARAFTGASSTEEAYRSLKNYAQGVAMTAGPDGAFVRFEGEEFHSLAFVCEPVDLTGAGDAYAGGFLFGITNGFSPQLSSRAGCYLSSKVICQVGARLHSGVRDAWNEISSAFSK